MAKTKPKKPNITTKMIPKPNVATVIETHFEVDIIVIKIDNQMVVIQV